MKLINNIIDKKKDLTHKLKIHIRKKAIKQFEKKLELLQKKVSDYPKNELEAFVAEEEKEIIKSYRNKSIGALLALLGFNIF
jgi:ABC-type Fe3+-hydroxamate transport system substrate-binding protein